MARYPTEIVAPSHKQSLIAFINAHCPLPPSLAPRNARTVRCASNTQNTIHKTTSHLTAVIHKWSSNSRIHHPPQRSKPKVRRDAVLQILHLTPQDVGLPVNQTSIQTGEEGTW